MYEVWATTWDDTGVAVGEERRADGLSMAQAELLVRELTVRAATRVGDVHHTFEIRPMRRGSDAS